MALPARKISRQLLVNCINGKSKMLHQWWGIFFHLVRCEPKIPSKAQHNYQTTKALLSNIYII